MIDQLAYNWWIVALRGALAVIIGIIAFFFPGITLVVLIAIFGSFVLLEGSLLLIAGIRSRKENERWWILIFQGLLSLGVAIITFVAPMATALALLYLMAAWAIASGVIEVVAAMRLRKEVKGEWILVLDGVITILFGLALILAPDVGLLVWIWMIGGFKLASGILLIILAFKLKRFRTRHIGSVT